jgi:hypothetical protein
MRSLALPPSQLRHVSRFTWRLQAVRLTTRHLIGHKIRAGDPIPRDEMELHFPWNLLKNLRAGEEPSAHVRGRVVRM